MIYYLKHKNVNVLKMEIDNETENIIKIIEVINSNHIPVGVRCEQDIVDRKALNNWLMGRSIPASRENILETLQTLNLANSAQLISKCFGLSLSDCYWLCPIESSLDFDKINFFDNEFSKDMGEILFGNDLKEFSLMSPDNTSDGWLKKKWIIKNDKRYLVKGGSSIYKQEPFNEKIASKVCEKLEIPHVKYDVQYIENAPYSVCENFLSSDTEFISAWSVYSHYKKPNDVSSFEHLIDCYEKMGIKNPRESIEKMLVLDFIIANTDRHMNNFGIIRDANTLEVLGVSPIFDSGTSLFMSTPSAISVDDIASKPFKKMHSEQIKLVCDVCNISDDTTNFLVEYAKKVLSENAFMDANRLAFITDNFSNKIKMINEISLQQKQDTNLELKM